MIRVLVADDHPIFRSGVSRLIDGEDDLTIVGEVADGAKVIDEVRATKADVLVLDLSLPNRSGMALLEALKVETPHVRTVILSMYPEDQLSLSLVRRGALAYLNKARDPMELLKAIRRAAEGKRYLTETLSDIALGDQPSDDLPHQRLTAREYQVFILLVAGKSVGATATELCMSASTASNHVAAIKQKLGASSVSDVVLYAARVGLV